MAAARAKLSAGLVMYRGFPTLEVFLIHPGGPFFAKKDLGAWSIPKGLVEPGEDPRLAALREFSEEVGLPVTGELLDLGSVTQKGGKRVSAWAFAGDAPEGYAPASNSFEIEWPPRSGRRRRSPRRRRPRSSAAGAMAARPRPVRPSSSRGPRSRGGRRDPGVR